MDFLDNNSFRLNSEDSEAKTILSNIFIDDYMPEADGYAVKLYLYLLRCQQANRDFSIPDIADKLNFTDNDVKRGINYWIRKGLLQMDNDETGKTPSLTLRTLTRRDEPAKPAAGRNFQLLKSSSDISDDHPSAGTSLTKEELDAAMTDPDYAMVLKTAENFFKRTLSNDDIDAFLRIYKDIFHNSDAPLDLCICLIKECSKDLENHKERTKPAYYIKIALNWANNGVRTPEDIDRYNTEFFFGPKLLRALGIRNRNMTTDVENRFIEEWRTKYNYSDEVMIAACERAVTHKGSATGFGYVNGILKSWYEKGIRTIEDVEKLDKKPSGTRKPASKGMDFMQGNMDDEVDLIEKMALKKAFES